jgi:hypothetical protein
MYFSSHGDEALTQTLEQLFSVVYIIVIEYALSGGSDDIDELYFDELSKGRLTPEDVRSIRTGDQQFAALHEKSLRMEFSVW